MAFKQKNGICYYSLGGAFPPGCQTVTEPFDPLVLLTDKDPTTARGIYAIDNSAQLEETPMQALLPHAGDAGVPAVLRQFIEAHGATVLNTAFSRCFDLLEHWRKPKKSGFRVTLVGLGDVGGTVLAGLKLLGKELCEIAIFDPNLSACQRYEMELNQVLSPDGSSLPEVTICQQDALFDCDLLLFTASRGVPPLEAKNIDVRMAQFDANRSMIAAYAKQAREANFMGLFCQISDPVDLLSRAVFCASNRDTNGQFDGRGLLPEQVQGFGLGVMAARSAYYAKKYGVDFSAGRVYGPHGAGLIVANNFGAGFDAACSEKLTELTRQANLEVRALGYKPYIAPGLSSAAISILQLLRGQMHYGAIPLGGVYFGCRSRFTSQGLVTEREAIHPALVQALSQCHQTLWETFYE